MKFPVINATTTIAAVGLLMGVLAQPAGATHKCEDYGLKPVGLFSDGVGADAFVNTKRRSVGETTKFVAELGIRQLSMDDLAELLRQMNEDPTRTAYKFPVPTALQGISGLATTLLLQRLIFVDSNGRFSATGGTPISKKILYGKIRDYIFDDATKSGHLNVDTCTDDVLSGRRDFLHWDVEVENKGYVVTKRDDSKPANPFSLPAHFKMPAAALDPSNSHSIWHRGLRP